MLAVRRCQTVVSSPMSLAGLWFTPARYIVQVPVSIGGRAFRVTSGFVNAVWPTAANKAAAVASGVLVTQAGSTVEVHYCDLLP